MSFYQRLEQALAARERDGTLRELPLVSYSDNRIVLDAQSYLDLSSNDYLGVARDPKYIKTFLNTMLDTERSGSEFAGHFLMSGISAGATGSRLLTGNHSFFFYVEELIASLYNRNQPEAKASIAGAGAVSDNVGVARAGAAAHAAKNTGIEAGAADTARAAGAAEIVGAVGTAGAAGAASAADPWECLYLSSGFEANEGILSTLFGKHDLLLVDKLAHASIIDGMLKSQAKALRYRHNDMEHLAALLAAHAASYENVCIVTESVFSMDGDQAKLSEIVALKQRYPNVLLYVDEAHSFGLLGAGGLGLCEELGLLSSVDFLMCTLSKAIGSYGAFLLCKPVVKNYLVNFMRPFIYSTALPAVNISFSLYILGLLHSSALQAKRLYLRKITAYLHSNLREMGLTPSQSQIQPLITGDNDKAALACSAFKRAGMLALPIRYPTVPQGQARLRLSLSSCLLIDDIDRITRVIAHCRQLFV